MSYPGSMGTTTFGGYWILGPVGDAVSTTRPLGELIQSTLSRIYSAGYLHDNVARRNFWIRNILAGMNVVPVVSLPMQLRR